MRPAFPAEGAGMGIPTRQISSFSGPACGARRGFCVRRGAAECGRAAALLFSWYALGAAKWPSSAARTFGYHRVGILAALVNAVSLVVIALLILWEAAERLRLPRPVHAGVMIAVASAAILVNGLIAFWL